MSNQEKRPVVLAGIHAVAYWLSSKPKHLDIGFEQELLAFGNSLNSPISYLGDSMNLQRVPFPTEHALKLTSAEARDLCGNIGGWPPVHITSNTAPKSVASLSYVRSCAPSSIPENCLVQIDEHIFVPIPELVLVQAAPLLNEVQLLVLCSLFFGVFCFGPCESNNIIPRRALCSSASVAAFIQACQKSGKSPDGVTRLARVCKRALEQTASPAEINCGLRMELPQSMSGYGFGPASHNAQVSTSEAFSNGMQHSRWCDFLWETKTGKRVAVEYESDEEHSGDSHRKKDRIRDNELTAAGIIPISLLSEHLVSTAKMDEAAFQISRELGVSPPISTADAYMKRNELRTQIVSAINRFKSLVV